MQNDLNGKTYMEMEINTLANWKSMIYFGFGC